MSDQTSTPTPAELRMRIDAFQEREGLSRKQLAKLLNVSRTTIDRYKNGESTAFQNQKIRDNMLAVLSGHLPPHEYIRYRRKRKNRPKPPVESAPRRPAPTPNGLLKIQVEGPNILVEGKLSIDRVQELLGLLHQEK